MLLHVTEVIVTATFSGLSFWGIVVVDAKRRQDKIVKGIRSGAVRFFQAGGIIYHDAHEINGCPFFAARPIHPEGSEASDYNVIDPASITREILPETLGIPAGNAGGHGPHQMASGDETAASAI